MATNPSNQHASESQIATIQWLLGSDPSIRWQVLRDLTDASPDEVAAERAKIATEGWGSQLLRGQDTDGYWGVGTSNPEWVTLRALLLLRDMGLDPVSAEAQRVVACVRENVTWQGVLPQDAAWHGKPLFAGEVEPCINGRVVALGSYFGEDVQGVVDRLLGEQMADGGGTANRKAVRRADHFILRSASSKGFWSTSRPRAARRQ